MLDFVAWLNCADILWLKCSGEDIALGSTSLEMLDKWGESHEVCLLHRRQRQAGSRYEIHGAGVKEILSNCKAAAGDLISVSVDPEGRLILDADTAVHRSSAVAEAFGGSGIKREEGAEAADAAAAPARAENLSGLKFGVVVRERNARSGRAKLGGKGEAGGGEAGGRGEEAGGGSLKVVASWAPAGSGGHVKVESGPAATPAVAAAPAVPLLVSRRKSSIPKRVVRHAAPVGPGKSSAAAGTAVGNDPAVRSAPAATVTPVKAEPGAMPAGGASAAAVVQRQPATAAAGRTARAAGPAPATAAIQKRSGTTVAGGTAPVTHAVPSPTTLHKRTAAVAAGLPAPAALVADVGRKRSGADAAEHTVPAAGAMPAATAGRKRARLAAAGRIQPATHNMPALAVGQEQERSENPATVGHAAHDVAAADGQRSSGTKRALPRGRPSASTAGERPPVQKAVLGPAGITKVKQESGPAGAVIRGGGTPKTIADHAESPARYAE